MLNFLGCSVSLIALCAMTICAKAQNVETASQGANEPFDLGTLVLTTARRTTEDVADVPASVQVLGNETLQQTNVDDFNEAVQQLPNVNVALPRDPRSGEISIRGVSSLNIASTAPTVGVFQNGVLQNATGLRFNNTPDLVDLERVEVLYGPQGTAYGRGTIGGAVNFVTAKPIFEQETELTFSFSDLEDGRAEAVFNTPLSDNLAVRAVFYGDVEEGFVSTPFAPGGNLGTENTGTRISLRYQPNDRLTIDGSVQYDVSSYDAPLYATLGSIFAGNPVSLVNQVPGNEIERLNLFLEVSQEVDAGLITSTTGYLDSTLRGTEDFDFSQATNSLLGRDNSVKSFSQEIRFESRDYDVSVGTVSFNVGANYSNTASATLADFQVFGGIFGAPGRNQAIGDLDVANYGVFGDLRWRPVAPLEIALGGRFSQDIVRIVSGSNGVGGLVGFSSPAVARTATFSAFTPNISVLYDWTDAISTYATVSTGYKPGGFSARTTNGNSVFVAYEEEEAINYEIGLKSSFFDGNLSVNASVFLIEFDNIQVPIPFNPITLSGGGIDNAAEALSEGAELSFLATPLPGLTLGGAFGYTNARFLNYNAPTGPLSGQSLPNAPEITYSLSADYELPRNWGPATPFVRGEVNHTSSFIDSVGSNLDVGDFTLVNLRAGLRAENFDVSLFVENLFDERYVLERFGLLGVPGEPRKFGIVGSFRF